MRNRFKFVVKKLVNKDYPIRKSTAAPFLGCFCCNAERNFVTRFCIFYLSLWYTLECNKWVLHFHYLKHGYHHFLIPGGNPTFLRWQWVEHFHWNDCRLVSRLNNGIHVSSTVTIDERKVQFILLSCDNIAWHYNMWSFVFISHYLWNPSGRNFPHFQSSWMMMCTDPMDMPSLAAVCSTVFHNHLFHSHNHVWSTGPWPRLFQLSSHVVWPFWTVTPTNVNFLCPQHHHCMSHSIVDEC